LKRYAGVPTITRDFMFNLYGPCVTYMTIYGRNYFNYAQNIVKITRQFSTPSSPINFSDYTWNIGCHDALIEP
jgi:hypothetical protein